MTEVDALPPRIEEANCQTPPGSPSEPPPSPVVPCLVVCSAEYERASLARKFRAATTGTIPGVLDVQRRLQRTIRTPDFDPWKASLMLVEIERYVRRTGGAS